MNVDKLKERLGAVKQLLIEKTAERLGPIADDYVITERLSKCNSCDYIFKPTMQCTKCGCFVQIKARVVKFSCPIDKW